MRMYTGSIVKPWLSVKINSSPFMSNTIIAKPLVSIVIPTFNRAEFLKTAIDSVLSQTYSNFELLILDNNSTDHTQFVISSYSDSRIKSIRHLANIGGVSNWLYGMQWTKGEFFSVLGDDDFYRPDFIERRISTFVDFPDALSVFSDHDECDENGQVSLCHAKTIGSGPISLSGIDLLKTLDNNNRTWIIGSGLYRRDPIVQWWAECIHSGKAFDTAIQVLIACRGLAVYIPGKGLVYRRHFNQDSQSSNITGILIGHVNAYIEPLVYFNNDQYAPELKMGALWALNCLATTAFYKGDRNQAARIAGYSLHIAFWNINAWRIYALIYFPGFIIRFMRVIKRTFRALKINAY